MKAAYRAIELATGRRVQAVQVRHLRVLTTSREGSMFRGNTVRAIFAESDGTEHVCQYPEGDARVLPHEEG